MVVKRVAVIGAGPAGAIAVDALAQEKAFDTIRVFERQENSGGLWTYDGNQKPKIHSLRDIINQKADRTISTPPQLPSWTPKDPEKHGYNSRYSYTPMHDHLESNIDARVMSYTQEPFPDSLTASSVQRWGSSSPFRHRSIIQKWISSLINRKGYEKLVQYNTTVELAEKIGSEWVLTLRQSKNEDDEDFWWQETFDAIVVANGHYNIPFIPTVPGLEDVETRFPGTVEHSKSYRGIESGLYSRKKVIVVGASVSATDIARDLALAADIPVYSSVRGPHPVFGLKAFEHPNIVIKPTISRVESSLSSTEHRKLVTVFFSDDSKIEDVDHIIFGTGYVFSLPFLPSVKIVNRRLDGFYFHVWKQDDPTLAIVGGVSGGFTFRVFEWQAVAVARVLAGRGKLPSLTTQQEWERARLAATGEGVPFYKIGPAFEEYFTELKNIAGTPKPQGPGRILLDWDAEWLEIFGQGLQARMDFWKREVDSLKNNTAGFVSGEIVRAKL